MMMVIIVSSSSSSLLSLDIHVMYSQYMKFHVHEPQMGIISMLMIVAVMLCDLRSNKRKA